MTKNEYQYSFSKLGLYQCFVIGFGIFFNLVIFYLTTQLPFHKLTPGYKCTSASQPISKTCTIQQYCSSTAKKTTDSSNSLKNWFTDLNLNCENQKSFFKAIISGKFVTMAVGTLFLAYLGDLKGRYLVNSIMIFAILGFNISIVLTTNLSLMAFWMIALYFFNFKNLLVVYMKENLQQPVYTATISVFTFIFALVGLSTGWMYELIQDWKVIQWIIASFALIACLINFLVLRESPDFLAKNQDERAEETFNYIGRMNNESSPWNPPSIKEKREQISFYSMFMGDSAFRRDFLLVTTVRMIDKFVFQAICMNLELVDVNVFVSNQIFFGCGMVGSVLGGMVANRFGRTSCLKVTAFLCFSCFLGAFLFFESRVTKLILFGVASAGVLAFGNSVYIYVPEVFPMKIRSTCSGISAVISNFGCALIPFVIVGTESLLVYAGLFFISLIVSFFCRETLKENKTEVLEEIHKLKTK